MVAVPLRHPEFLVDSASPFEQDKVGREAFVRDLCARVMAQEQAAVVAITGGFGTGKSAALQMCAAVLRDEGAIVTEFNAWQQSHTRNPLVDLASALSKERPEVWKRVLKVALRISSSLVSGMTGVPVGFDNLVDSQDGVKNDPFAAWAAIEKGVSDFKNALAAVVEGTESRFIVLIDELDRCVPNYAMELLNVARHLFDVPGVVIVLGVNRSELGHRVQQVYGENCDADAYLRRFVDLPIQLPRPEAHHLSDYTRGVVASAGAAQVSTFLSEALELLVAGGNASLRDSEQIARRFTQLRAAADRPTSYWTLGTVAMLVLGVVDRSAFEDLAAGRTTSFEAIAALRESLPEASVTQSPRAATLDRVEQALLLLGGSQGYSAFDLEQEEFNSGWVGAGLGDHASAIDARESLAGRRPSGWDMPARRIADGIDSVWQPETS